MANTNVKLIVMGKGGVGKSCLTHQFVQNRFIGSSYNATIEDKFTKHCEVDGKAVFCEILDTAGQDQYSALRRYFMPTGDAFLLVYDVTNDSTFEEINPLRDEIFAANTRANDLPFILLGNKCDDTDNRVVEEEEGRKLQDVLGKRGGVCRFFETSAKTNVNVKEAFREAISLALRLNTNHATGAGAGGVMGAGTKNTVGQKKKKSGCMLL
eukprot:g1065.t1